MSAPHTRYVDDERELQQLIARLRDHSWFALDTEFEREKTYYPKLCLLQVATPEWVACVDPHALENFDALRDIMLDTTILKVLHACAQDCEVLYQRWHAVPTPLFDTQVAAPLLGYAEQIGYANLVEQMLGVHLPKSHTRTDWCRRPLSDAQLRYAEDDARYLAELYLRMHEALVQNDRLSWLAHDFAELSNSARYTNPPQDAWQRLKRLDRMSNSQLAIAQALAEWREATAQTANLPRAWLLRDDTLLDLARVAPTDLTVLKTMDKIHPRLVSRYGRTLLAVIAAARENAPRALPDARPAPLTPAESAALAKLQAAVHKLATQHALDPDVLASRKKLVRIVRGAAPSEVFKGWRLLALRGALD
ncbi:MAG: ribonuclease D [Gammaproteobacteria bacterium]|nr:ribonuclease D [Gammaproteobacteria bacterium]